MALTRPNRTEDLLARILCLTIVSLALTMPAVASGATGYYGPADGPASVFASAVPKGITLGGLSGESDPFVVGVSRDGKRLTGVVVRWSTTCDSGLRLWFAGPLVPGAADHPLVGGRLSRNGSFSLTSSGKLDFGDYEGAVTQSGKGRLAVRRSSGTWQAHVDVFERATGTKVDNCDTGSFRWGAGAQQNLTYGGVTTEGEPVVLRLNAARTKVSVLSIGWHASCSDGTIYEIGDGLADFPLSRAGRFGDTFTQRFPVEGGELRYAYVIRGKVGRARASGTFKVTRTVHDESGATLVTCEAPSARWTAAQ